MIPNKCLICTTTLLALIGLTCAGAHNSRLTESVNVVDDDDKVAEDLGERPILIALPDDTAIVVADWYDRLAGSYLKGQI